MSAPTGKRSSVESRQRPTANHPRRALVLAACVSALAVLAVLVVRHMMSQGFRDEVGPGPVPGTTTVTRSASLDEQRGMCAGTQEPQNLVKLNAAVRITEAIRCTRAGREETKTRNTDNGGAFDDLASALVLPDEPRNGDCPAVYPMVPAFAVKVDGIIFRPALPLDRCGFPQNRSDSALQAVFASP